MTPPLEQLRATIAAAIAKARAEGWGIASGGFIELRLRGDYEEAGWCCPLGAVAVAAGLVPIGAVPKETEVVLAIAAELGVSERWVWSFSDGFDSVDLGRSTPWRRPEPDLEAFELGRAIRLQVDAGEKLDSATPREPQQVELPLGGAA